jgi:glutathione S-transferase
MGSATVSDASKPPSNEPTGRGLPPEKWLRLSALGARARRPAPGEPARLVTLRVSHYCEKARWALERGRVPFVEEGHAPILSWRATFGSGAGRTVPALIASDTVLADSTDILRWVDARAPEPWLFPPGTGDEHAALEDLFDRRLGPATRRLAYFHLLPERARARRILGQGIPRSERALMAVAFPVVAGMIKRGLGVTAEKAARSRVVIDEVFAEVGRRLADGRRYLTGDRFGAADLTFAALCVPSLLPDPWRARMGGAALDPLPEAVERLRAELGATQAGRFARRLYEEER